MDIELFFIISYISIYMYDDLRFLINFWNECRNFTCNLKGASLHVINLDAKLWVTLSMFDNGRSE